MKQRRSPFRQSPAQDSIPDRLYHSQQVRGRESVLSAIANAESESSVLLAPEEWSVSKPFSIDKSIGISGDRSKIIATMGAVTSASSPFISITANNVTLSGLRIHSDLPTGVAIFIDADYVQIVNCIISGFYTAIKVNSSSYVRIENNSLLSFTGTGIEGVSSLGGRYSGNLITNGAGNEIGLDSGSRGNLIVNNIVPGGSISYVNTGSKGNIPDTAAIAAYSNIAASISVS